MKLGHVLIIFSCKLHDLTSINSDTFFISIAYYIVLQKAINIIDQSFDRYYFYKVQNTYYRIDCTVY